MESHIVLVTNLFRDAGFEKARQIYHLLTGAGHDVIASPVFLPKWEPSMLSGMNPMELTITSQPFLASISLII